jgi:hypothetical protein
MIDRNDWFDDIDRSNKKYNNNEMYDDFDEEDSDFNDQDDEEEDVGKFDNQMKDKKRYDNVKSLADLEMQTLYLERELIRKKALLKQKLNSEKRVQFINENDLEDEIEYKENNDPNDNDTENILTVNKLLKNRQNKNINNNENMIDGENDLKQQERRIAVEKRLFEQAWEASKNRTPLK